MKKRYEKPTLAVTAAAVQEILLTSGDRIKIAGELDDAGNSIGFTVWDEETWG